MPTSSSDPLRTAIDQLPDDASVPVRWLRQLLGNGHAPATGLVDFRIGEVAALLGLSPSSVRSYCAAGLFPGAYRRARREWRIPRASLGAYQDTERERHTARSAPEPTARSRRSRPLDSWRKIASEGE